MASSHGSAGGDHDAAMKRHKSLRCSGLLSGAGVDGACYDKKTISNARLVNSFTFHASCASDLSTTRKSSTSANHSSSTSTVRRTGSTLKKLRLLGLGQGNLRSIVSAGAVAIAPSPDTTPQEPRDLQELSDGPRPAQTLWT